MQLFPTRNGTRHRITLVVGIFPPAIGGPAIFAERFLSWSKNHKIECNVVTYCTSYSEIASDVSKIQLSKPRIFSFLKFVFKVVQQSKSSDVILANGCFIEVFIASFFSRFTYIIKLPGDPVWEYARNRKKTTLNIEEFQKFNNRGVIKLWQYLYKLSYRRAKIVICPSSQLFEFALSWGVSREKLRIIYNSVSPSIFSPKSNSKIQFDLATSSRLVSWKNIDELIEMSAKMNLTLAIAGSGPEISKLKRLSSELSAPVEFLGELENRNVPDFLSKARCFVLNSEFEATSYALIEAKMMGLPVIARDSAGSREVIRNRLDGFLIKNQGELEQAIKCVLFGSHSSQFSQSAREDALLRFNQEKNFTQIYKVLTEINA